MNEKREKFGGREKGTPNKVTAEIREKFEQLLEANLDTLQDDLNAMTPRWRVHYVIEIAKFCIPTLKATDLEVNTEGMQPIIITGMDIK